MCLDSAKGSAPSVLRLPCGVPVLMNHATKKGEATLSHCGTIFGDNGSRTLFCRFGKKSRRSTAT